MSKATHAIGAIAGYPSANAGPIFRAGYLGTGTINEGDSVTFVFQLLNPQPGAAFVWAFSVGSGDVISEKNWVDGFVSKIVTDIRAAGFTVLYLDKTTTTPSRTYTVDLLITLPAGSAYDGREVQTVCTARKNRQNDVNPRNAYVTLMRNSGTSTVPVTWRGLGGQFLTINDTSQKPTGQPTFTMQGYATDGFSPPKVILNPPVDATHPGDSFIFRITTENMIPGTKVKMYAANAAQYFLKPSWRDSLLAALKAAAPLGVTYEETRYPPPTGQVWYNGYTIVFGEGWDNTQHIDIPVTMGQALPDNTATQIDFICTVTAEGTVADFTESTQSKGNWNSTATYVKGDIVTFVTDGAQYVALQGVGPNLPPDTNTNYWRLYTPLQILKGGGTFFSQLPPPRFWEIRAKSNGTTISYSLQVPVNTSGDSVKLSAVNAPAGFIAAIAAAAAAPGSPVTFDGVDTFTPNALATNAAANGVLYQKLDWTRPHSGTGLHTLTLHDSTSSPITIGDACVYYQPLPAPVDPKFITGVNASGGEFGNVPGIYGTDYRYPVTPEQTNPALRYQPLDYLWNMGVKIIRLPVRWQRIQRTLYGPLSGEKDPAVAWDSGTPYDIARCDDTINYWTGLGGIVLFDVHNYGTRGKDPITGVDQIIGWFLPVKVDAFIDLWERLANRYKSNTKVWFDLMNEPKGTGWGPWSCRENFQWVLNRIRMTGCTNKVLIGGQHNDSAAEWVSSGQGDAYVDFYDPCNNFAFTPHCYFDTDGSGTKGFCVTNANTRISSVTAWARANGFKLFLGEVAGGDPANSDYAVCGTVVPAAYQYMTTNKDVWLGWTTWGYGPRWGGGYMFRLDPGDYTNYSAPSGTFKMLQPYIATEY